MNVLVISTNRSALPTPVLPAGACLVAEAAEQAGHAVTLLDLMFEARPLRTVRKAIQKTKPDVIGLSVRNIDNNDMQGTKFYIDDLAPLVSAIRTQSDAPIILGGAALGVMPEQILRTLGADCAVIGEGEETFRRLLGRIERHQYGTLPGVASIAGGIFKTNPPPRATGNQCPVPDYHRWLNVRAYRSRMCTVPLQTKLGCQFHCVYCTYRKIEGGTYRLFEPDSVAEKALRLASSGLHDIEFVDNVFNAPQEHALRLCESFLRAGVRARLQTVELNPAYLDHQLLSIMERAGFVGMGLTVESASDRVLRELRKGFTAREVFRAAEMVREHRIPCLWIFMLGGPGETRETVRETLRFAEENITPADAAYFNVGVRIYPGTELETVARREDVLGAPPERMLQPVFYVSPGLDAEWIMSEVRSLMKRHMNFMNADSFSFPYLPLIHRIGYSLGVRSPLWRYTRYIRTGLRTMGLNA